MLAVVRPPAPSGCADPGTARCLTPRCAARSPPLPRHERCLVCSSLYLRDIACPRSRRALCSPAWNVPYPVLLRGMPRCAVPRTHPPLPPAAAPGSSCDPPGMCPGNYSPDGTRGHGRELGEAQAEGGPRPRSPETGWWGHRGSLRTDNRAGGSCREFFFPLSGRGKAGLGTPGCPGQVLLGVSGPSDPPQTLLTSRAQGEAWRPSNVLGWERNTLPAPPAPWG